MKVDLEALDKLFADATPGEWFSDCGRVHAAETEDRLGFQASFRSGNRADATKNSRLVSKLHNAYPAMRDELLAAREVIDAARSMDEGWLARALAEYDQATQIP